MSLKSIVEAVVHLESFRNIELFYQGLYYLKCSLYSETPSSEPDQPNVKQFAQPYCSFVSQIQMEKQAKINRKGGVGSGGQQYDHHNLLASRIIDSQSAFCSKTFLIRYCEEEVEINDIILFRAEIDVEEEYLNTDFYFQVELYFSNLEDIGGSEAW